MEKISFGMPQEEAEEFYVLEQTVLGGVCYLLVTDSDEDEAEAMILKDLSAPEDTEALYVPVEDEQELEAVSKIFQEILEDIEIDFD